MRSGAGTDTAIFTALQLAGLGYRSCRYLTTAEAQAQYFAGRTDGLYAPAMASMLVATV
jgi:hypothetical protein